MNQRGWVLAERNVGKKVDIFNPFVFRHPDHCGHTVVRVFGDGSIAVCRDCGYFVKEVGDRKQVLFGFMLGGA